MAAFVQGDNEEVADGKIQLLELEGTVTGKQISGLDHMRVQQQQTLCISATEW